jgi:hypothetical protein
MRSFLRRALYRIHDAALNAAVFGGLGFIIAGIAVGQTEFLYGPTTYGDEVIATSAIVSGVSGFLYTLIVRVCHD